jgi:hypothetical protein
VIHLVVSGSNCEGLVGAALRVPSYAASPLAPQISPGENQSMLPDPELPPSATNHFVAITGVWGNDLKPSSEL